jgi:hypothetical protein
MKTISLNYIYRNFYVSDARLSPSAPEGHTRLWCSDSLHYPSFTGNYDIPSGMVKDVLGYFEQNGTQTVEFKDLN